MMAERVLAKSGLYLDELNKIRVVSPQTANNSAELKRECNDFLSTIGGFVNVVDSYTGLIEQLSRRVEREKIKAIGLRNLRDNVEKQKAMELEQLRAVVREKQVQLERLKVQYETLSKEETDQRETLLRLLTPH